MSATTTDLNALFPLPPSTRSPARVVGVTHASGEALIKTLKDNHIKWHAFFNDRGFHNHASHHLVAIYALGASGPLIEAAYQTHVAYMKPAFKAPEPVDEANFWTHLGKPEFYSSYLEFFKALLLKKDVSEVLEEYVFSVKANVGGHGVQERPRMLNRYLAALLHPIIHVGNGLEFGLLGLVAEGLAQTAVHTDQGGNLISPGLFDTNSADWAITRLTALMPSLSLSKSLSAGEAASVKGTGTKDVHAFTVLARVLADKRFSPDSIVLGPMEMTRFTRVGDDMGETIAELADEWAAELQGNGATADAITRKIEEVCWMNALIYGVGGWGGRERTPNKKFNADFFYMHLVTSTLFLPSTVAYLSPRSATVLLKAYFSFALAWYIAQGRPALPIREFYEGTTAMPAQPGEPRTTPGKDTLTPADASPNPWLPIVQTTLVHPAEHLCKVQRTLMHDATLYGTRKAGDFAGLGLEGAEVLDGTLFIRAAALTADRIGWMKEGQEAGDWDRVGF